MDGVTPYYYRGTTRNWPGNQELGLTCVSTDPLVATLFAVECRNHGMAAVIIASKQRFAIGPPNHFAIEESAVNLQIAPADFEAGAECIIEVDLALQVLAELGFPNLPERMPRSQLQDAILDSFAQHLRLSLAQIREFDRKIAEALQ